MHQAALLYSSKTGTTARVAHEIARQLEGLVHEVLDVATIQAANVEQFDALILGIPTYGEDRLPDAWVSFLDGMSERGLRGKLVAVFGLGDQAKYPERFQDAMGLLFDRLKDLGAQFIGAWSTEGYAFDGSKAVDRGSFVGLAIDAETQDVQTDARIRRWTSQIRLALEERCSDPLPHTLG